MQTKRICGLVGYYVKRIGDGSYLAFCEHTNRTSVYLPNGSFTLDQVVGMLKEEKAEWCYRSHGTGAWHIVTEERMQRIDENRRCRPHDLTAAMDALIKVLETKGKIK